MKGAFFDPGRLRHEMVLEEPVRVADALGGHDVTWSAVATLCSTARVSSRRSRPRSTSARRSDPPWARA